MRITAAFIAILIIVGYSNLSYGHGGRLASDGCHNDTRAGNRHCHRDCSPADTSPPNNPPPTTNPPAAAGACGDSTYDRDSWGYSGRSFSTNVGYYSGVTCSAIDADHVVALKDAHDSGGCSWSGSQKSQFANDVDNLVPSCARINRSKGAALPAQFISRADDGSGVEFTFSSNQPCAYLAKYKEVKAKYGLSFSQNDSVVFQACSISLP